MLSTHWICGRLFTVTVILIRLRRWTTQQWCSSTSNSTMTRASGLRPLWTPARVYLASLPSTQLLYCSNSLRHWLLDSDSKGAVNRMRESYNIFLNELGAQDKNTKEAENWLEQLTQNAVSIAKHHKEMEAKNRARFAGARLSSRITVGQTQHQPQVGQLSGAVSGRDPRGAPRMDSRSIDELLKYIEGSENKNKTKKTPQKTNPKRRVSQV